MDGDVGIYYAIVCDKNGEVMLVIESHFSLVENTTRHIYLSCSIIDLFWANQLYKFVAHDLAFHAYIFQHSSLWLEDHPPWANSIVRSDPVCV